MNDKSQSSSLAFHSRLKLIDDKTKLIVYGYIRRTEKNIVEVIAFVMLSYYWIPPYWFKGSADFTINESIATKRYTTGKHGDNRTIYGNQLVNQGKYEWEIKVLSNDHKIPRRIHMVIGITDNTDYCHDWAFYKYHNHSSYGYHSLGSLHTCDESTAIYSVNDNVKNMYYSDKDIITVHLDMDRKTVHFSKNGIKIKNRFENIDTTKPFRLTVSAHYVAQAVQMVSLKKIK